MNRLPRPVIWIAKTAAVVGLVAVLIYGGLLLRWPSEKPLGYWAIDDRTLGVVVLDTPNLVCDVVRVDESSDAVRIHAQCRERVIPVPETGMAQQYVFHVTLKAPLAGRTVYDGSGRLAQLCQKPAPGCWYSG